MKNDKHQQQSSSLQFVKLMIEEGGKGRKKEGKKFVIHFIIFVHF
jgi:hypothetical protein